MSTFAIGEIAIVANSRFPERIGKEVVIAEICPPGQRCWADDGPFTHVETSYVIDADWLPPAPHGIGWITRESWLKKRPPPPDWMKYADPRSLPIEDKRSLEDGETFRGVEAAAYEAESQAHIQRTLK